ncbi:ChaN family lipoprotein [Pseudoalteromonas sp. B62]|uniref:ChaN family lipoprotein n=1 Tax=Pseudoalteromonas sp. B62 TaxID=630483 RepID=UPI00301C8D5C
MNKINTDVNYKTMAGNARLVMLGESSHSTAGYKYEAIKAIKQLKAAGFTHFAIEMLPRAMQEKIDFYQRTGKGFNVIQQYFNKYWTHGYLTPHAYGELVKAARDIGMKIVALDVLVETMDIMDSVCSSEKGIGGDCFDTHTYRNALWAVNLATILNRSSQNRVVAFMHRSHAVLNAADQPGVDVFLKDHNIFNVRFIDFIGGLSCISDRRCSGDSNQDKFLKERYFYREGYPYESSVKSFQVHIPEKRVNSDGSLQW